MITKNALRDPATLLRPSQILVLFGSTSKLHPLVLQAIFRNTRRAQHVGVIVGDNHLDAYAFARLARAYGFNPAIRLAQIEFSRPFTCHQLHHCVVNLTAEKIGTWSALYVLGLLDMFYDEDIRLPIVARWLDDVLDRLRYIASQHLTVLITIAPPPRETTRAELVTRVIDAADAYWQPFDQAIENLTAQQMGLLK